MYRIHSNPRSKYKAYACDWSSQNPLARVGVNSPTVEPISSCKDFYSQTMASALSEVGISDANDLRQLLHDPDDALATIAQFEEVNRINLELRLENIFIYS